MLEAGASWCLRYTSPIDGHAGLAHRNSDFPRVIGFSGGRPILHNLPDVMPCATPVSTNMGCRSDVSNTRSTSKNQQSDFDAKYIALA
jgi:hypothetical protein